MKATVAPSDDGETPWKVSFTAYACKQKEKLPVSIKARLLVLVTELKLEGPIQKEWKHFGRLSGSKKKTVYHCHLNSSRPVYVAIWEVRDREAKVLKIIYSGTHEKADYNHYTN